MNVPAGAAEMVAYVLLELGSAGTAEKASDCIPAGSLAVCGYFTGDTQIDSVIAEIQERLDEMNRAGVVETVPAVATRLIEEEDWAESWKAYYTPVFAGDRIVIRPSWWEKPVAAGPEKVIISLDPGMAFGTGNHPTTVLCLEMLAEYLPVDSVADIGTGSGILSIAARKLGVNRVVAVDTDPVAVDVARRNIRENGYADSIEVYLGSAAGLKGNAFHLVVMNIVTDVVLQLLPAVCDILKTGGILITSGIPVKDKHRVTEGLRGQGLRIESERTRKKWVAFAATNTGCKYN